MQVLILAHPKEGGSAKSLEQAEVKYRPVFARIYVVG